MQGLQAGVKSEDFSSLSPKKPFITETYNFLAEYLKKVLFAFIL